MRARLTEVLEKEMTLEDRLERDFLCQVRGKGISDIACKSLAHSGD